MSASDQPAPEKAEHALAKEKRKKIQEKRVAGKTVLITGMPTGLKEEAVANLVKLVIFPPPFLQIKKSSCMNKGHKTHSKLLLHLTCHSL